MKFSSITSPLRETARALSPNNVANKMVETGFRMGGPAGATIAGGVATLGGAYATYAVAEKLNALDVARNIGSDVAASPSLGGKLGAALGGAAELAVAVAAPAIMLTFAFESLDATAQAWDKPQNQIKIDN